MRGDRGDTEPGMMAPSGGQTRALAAATAEPLALRDGATVCIRAIRPDDAPRLIAFFAGLSRETLMRRFFRRVPPLSPEQATALARVDGADSLALVAAAGPEPGAAILAVARYDRVGTEEAELGFVVADGWQGRGIGTALFHRLAPYARSRGIRTFVAVTLTNNARVLRLLRRCGYPCAARIASIEVELRLDISGVPILRSAAHASSDGV